MLGWSWLMSFSKHSEKLSTSSMKSSASEVPNSALLRLVVATSSVRSGIGHRRCPSWAPKVRSRLCHLGQHGSAQQNAATIPNAWGPVEHRKAVVGSTYRRTTEQAPRNQAGRIGCPAFRPSSSNRNNKDKLSNQASKGGVLSPGFPQTGPGGLLKPPFAMSQSPSEGVEQQGPLSGIMSQEPPPIPGQAM